MSISSQAIWVLWRLTGVLPQASGFTSWVWIFGLGVWAYYLLASSFVFLGDARLDFGQGMPPYDTETSTVRRVSTRVQGQREQAK